MKTERFLRLGCLAALVVLICWDDGGVRGAVLYYVGTSGNFSSLNVLPLSTLLPRTLFSYPIGDVVTGGVAVGLTACPNHFFWSDQTLGQVFSYEKKTGQVKILANNLNTPQGISFDSSAGGWVYFVDEDYPYYDLYRVRTNGTSLMKVDVVGNAITAAMRDIKFYEGDLYIASDNGIAVIRAPSTTQPPLQLTILVPGLAIFEGVVRTANHMYFTSFDGPSSLYRSNADGTNVTGLFPGDYGTFYVTADQVGRQLYWEWGSAQETFEIRSTSFDVPKQKTLFLGQGSSNGILFESGSGVGAYSQNPLVRNSPK